MGTQWFVIAACLWKIYQLWRGQRTFPLVMVTAALVATVIGQSFPAVVGPSTLNAALGQQGYRIFDAGMVCISLFFTSLFFQSSARAGTLTRTRVRVEVALLLAALTATVVTVLVVAPDDPTHGPTSATRAQFAPGVAGEVLPIYLVSNTYYLWALAVSILGAATALRRASGSLRLGLGLVVTMLSILVLGVAGRLVVGSLVASGTTAAYGAIDVVSIAIAVGLLGFYLGVSLPGLWTRLVAGVVWLRRRRRFLQLAATASLFGSLFPELSFGAIGRFNLPERLGLWRVARNYYRRVIEIHDAIMLLSTYLDPAEVDAADDPGRQARYLSEALERMRAGRERRDHAVDLGVASGSDTLDGDGASLVALSFALRPLLR